MPNSTQTPQQAINDINRLLCLISGEANKRPVRGRDMAILQHVKEIQTEPLFVLSKYIEAPEVFSYHNSHTVSSARPDAKIIEE